MLPGPLECRFEDWREHGDLEALAAVFDAVAPELLRIAEHLVHDAPKAEDLVQTTFVEVLRQPQRFRRGSRLVPWLVGILTRQASKVRRAAARHSGAAVAMRCAPPPDDGVAAAELADLVRAALQQLAEPYRAIVGAHLLDGMRPVDLAEQRACAPATIRMQLSRGLSMLRRALPFGLVVPLAVLRAEAAARVRDTALSHAGALPTGAATLSVLGITIMTKLFVALVAAVVVALWVLAPTLTDRASAAFPFVPAASPPENAPTGGVSASAAMTSAGDSAALALRTAIPAAPATGLWLVGTVRSPRRVDQAPVAIDVRVWGLSSQLHIDVGDDGGYELDLLPLVRSASESAHNSSSTAPAPDLLLVVSASHAFCLPAMATPRVSLPDSSRLRSARQELRQDFDLRPAAVLRGNVTGLGGDNVMHTKIGVFSADSPRGEPAVTCSPDATGHFEVAVGLAGVVELWVTHPRRRPLLHRTTLVLGERTDIGVLRLDATAAAIRGRIELPAELQGNVLVAAQRVAAVAADARETQFEYLARIDGELVATLREAWSDAGGGFALQGLESGRWRVRVDSVPLWPLFPSDAGQLVDAPAADLVLLGDHVPMRAFAQGPAGPVSQCTITMRVGDDSTSQTSGDDGSVQWLGQRHVVYHVTVDDVRYEPFHIECTGEQLAAAPLRCDLRPRPTATLELTIVEERETGERQVAIHFSPMADAATGVATAGAADGPIVRQARLDGKPLRLAALPPGKFLVRVEPEHSSGLPFAVAGLPTATAEEVVELRANETTRATVRRPAVGRLRIRGNQTVVGDMLGQVEVRATTGTIVPTRTLSEQPGGWVSRAGRLDCGGNNVITPDLLPGSYTVVIHHPALGMVQKQVLIKAGEVATLEIER